MLTDFKKLVDEVVAADWPTDLEEQYNFLGINNSSSFIKSNINDTLYGLIKNSLSVDASTSTKLRKTDFFKFEKELVYLQVLYNENGRKYLTVIKTIRDSTRDDTSYLAPLSDVSAWHNAIKYINYFNQNSPLTHSYHDTLRNEYPREHDRAVSVKKLIELGCEVHFENSDFVFDKGLDKVVEQLNEKVADYGGLNLIKSLQFTLKRGKRYSKRFERFHIARSASGLVFDQKPHLPFGYLFNLGLKHPIEKDNGAGEQQKLTEIVNLAVLITNGRYGVQHYNYWSYFFQTGETIINFCQEIVLWDTIFGLPQMRVSSSMDICKNIFLFINDDEFETQLGFSRNSLFKVWDVINSLTKNINEPLIIYQSVIYKALRIDKKEILAILHFLSHAGQVNSTYNMPGDYLAIDFYLKPLLRLGNTKFLLPEKSWCAPNYFEALASGLRNHDPNMDSKAGYELENYLIRKLNEKNITVYNGEYRVDGQDGECDLLIECEKFIILIEVKKKVLTRKAKSGMDVELFLDLTDSMLTAQYQAGRTEIFLREKGQIQLVSKNGESKIVQYNDREIVRVGLTQLQYGSFQDQTIMRSFLQSLLTHSFNTNSTDKGIQKKFKKLEETRVEWVKQHNYLYNKDPKFAHFPYFNCWFLALPQMLEIIALANDNESFLEALTDTKHVTMNTLDWYQEMEYRPVKKRK